MSKKVAAPRFSVVVPTFDRPDQLTACLEGLARQSPAKTFEVIVAEDGGEPSAQRIAAELSDRLDITVVRQPRKGPGAARNLGASHARGRFLAFTDDDCVPQPKWLESFDEEALERGALLGGSLTNGLPGNPFATASHLIGVFVYRYYREHPSTERFFTTNNMAVPRDAFEALGGFDTSIPAATAEDKDLCDRWRASGGEVAHANAATVSHAHQLRFRSFLRQHYEYGRGILCFRVLRRARGHKRPARLRPEPISFYLRLVTFPMAELGLLRGLLISVLTGWSQVATILGALHGAVWDLPRLRQNRRET